MRFFRLLLDTYYQNKIKITSFYKKKKNPEKADIKF